MSRYVVTVEGCDDITYLVVDLSGEQAVGLELVANATVERSTSQCHPVIKFTPYDSAPKYDRERAEEPIDNE